MNFVYICRPGQNEELRYSIRSVMSTFPDAKVWVVGGKPDWYTGNYVQVRQNSTKYTNARDNLEAICNSEDIPENFILMNDDFFIVKPIKDIQYLNGGLLSEKIEYYNELTPNTSYVRSLQETHRRLLKRGIVNPLDYELHVPMPMHKVGLKASMAGGSLWRSVYGNMFGVGGETIKDVKVYNGGPLMPKSYDYEQLDQPYLSTDDLSFDTVLNVMLKDMFSVASDYEQG